MNYGDGPISRANCLGSAGKRPTESYGGVVDDRAVSGTSAIIRQDE